jgi:hypothetical protein
MQMSGFRPFEWQRIATPQPSGGDQIHPPFWDEIRFATPLVWGVPMHCMPYFV